MTGKLLLRTKASQEQFQFCRKCLIAFFYFLYQLNTTLRGFPGTYKQFIWLGKGYIIDIICTIRISFNVAQV